VRRCGTFHDLTRMGRALANSAAAPLPIKKGLVFDMLPAKLSYADRMKLARDVGFEVVQAPTTPDEHVAEGSRKPLTTQGCASTR